MSTREPARHREDLATEGGVATQQIPDRPGFPPGERTSQDPVELFREPPRPGGFPERQGGAAYTDDALVGVGVAKVSKPVGVGHSIVVQEGHHIAGGHFHAGVLAAGQPPLVPVLDDRHVGQNGAQPAVEVRIVVDNDDDLLWRRPLAPNRRYGGEDVVPPIECVDADHHAHGEGAPGCCACHFTPLLWVYSPHLSIVVRRVQTSKAAAIGCHRKSHS